MSSGPSKTNWKKKFAMVPFRHNGKFIWGEYYYRKVYGPGLLYGSTIDITKNIFDLLED